MIEVVAEIAQGYEGDLRQSLLLAKGAVKAGADAVKFQLVYADELATPDYLHYQLFKALEMPLEHWEKIASVVHQGGKNLLFDIFGQKSLDIAMKVGASGVKLSTTEFYNDDLLTKALSTGKKIYFSIGGIPVEDLEQKIRRHALRPDMPICFMYGFQAEPTPLESNNFARLIELKRRFAGFQFGFMDHSAGGSAEDATFLPLMAITTGIDTIEKHLSLDPLLELEDFISAVTPTSLAELIRLVRKFESVYGSSSLTLSADEIAYSKKAGKVAVAATPIASNTVLKPEHVVLKRIAAPETKTGLIKELQSVIGKRVCYPVKTNEPITVDLLSTADGAVQNA